jgi:hypothetical protein
MQATIPEEMSQSLLTNKKQGNKETDHACPQKPNSSREI